MYAVDFDGMEGLAGKIEEASTERGKARGLEQGKADGLTRLLERRFGPLPAPARDRIAAAGPVELDAWLDRILDADSLDTVFGSEAHQVLPGPACFCRIPLEIQVSGEAREREANKAIGALFR